MAFADHFSHDSGSYAAFRPAYPDVIFADVARLAPARRLAWDCATGNGQAARGLAPYFDRVIATDASAAQIGAAGPHPKIEFRVAPAERSGLDDESIDLVTVAQALHWFDFEAFGAEVRRVLVPGGIFAAWCYGVLEIAPEIDRIINRFYRETVGPWWPPERVHVEEGYRSIPIPLDEVEAPAWSLERPVTLDALIGYLGTWSAVKRYRDEHGRDPLPEVRAELESIWGADNKARPSRTPMAARIGRKSAGNSAGR